jgi:hypothetical protein
MLAFARPAAPPRAWLPTEQLRPTVGGKYDTHATKLPHAPPIQVAGIFRSTAPGDSVIQHNTDHRRGCGEKDILPYVTSLP